MLLLLLVILAVGVVSLLQIPLPGVRVSSHAEEAGLANGRFISSVSLALFALALLRLSAMLKRIAAGDRFSRGVTRPFRDFALLLLCSSLATLLLPAVIAVVTAGAGHRVELRFELRDAIFVVASLLLFLVARMLEDAARIEAELEEIV